MSTFDSEARSEKNRKKYLMLGALGFLASQGVVLFLATLIFSWEGELFSQSDICISALYAVFEAIIRGAFSVGRLFTFVRDYLRALDSYAVLQGWLSRKPRVAAIEMQ